MTTASDVPHNLHDRTWYSDNGTYAFLVHAPITFAHSQLKVSLATGVNEEDAFSLAAQHIAICIARFRTTFARFDLGEWGPLAGYTATSGHYVKTLVLKASANENQGEYKVHLVPCFSSHIEAAKDLFWARLDRSKTKPGGGLLHWIGQREHIVDYDTLSLDAVAADRIKSFCLTGLAATLRRNE